MTARCSEVQLNCVRFLYKHEAETLATQSQLIVVITHSSPVDLRSVLLLIRRRACPTSHVEDGPHHSVP